MKCVSEGNANLMNGIGLSLPLNRHHSEEAPSAISAAAYSTNYCDGEMDQVMEVPARPELKKSLSDIWNNPNKANGFVNMLLITPLRQNSDKKNTGFLLESPAQVTKSLSTLQPELSPNSVIKTECPYKSPVHLPSVSPILNQIRRQIFSSQDGLLYAGNSVCHTEPSACGEPLHKSNTLQDAHECH